MFPTCGEAPPPSPFPLGDFRIILLSVRHTVIEVEKGKGATEEKEEEGGGQGVEGDYFLPPFRNDDMIAFA